MYPSVTLPSGKVLEVVKEGQGLFIYQFTTGGELPAELKGRYTTPDEAVKTMNMYAARKAVEAEKKASKPKKETKEEK